ncbi:MAG: tRNA (adenosine(37)-N6)-threonylcarbamoyltransferase complex ATPase subunit type 1 TsaE [Allorhizobium sp.]
MNDRPATVTLLLEGEAATRQLGEDLALALSVGDCLALSGDLGAGKSTLARALIRAIADDDGLDVPSPTFTLVQTYDLRLAVAHFDLYRLNDPHELDELGFDEALSQGICLVEWPDKAGSLLPTDLITIDFLFGTDDRTVTISASAPKMARIRRVLAIRQFLTDHGLGQSTRRHMTGDASSRAYESVTPSVGDHMILMDAARLPEGVLLRDGKSYAEIVHLARDVYPFVAIGKALCERGFAAPRIFHADCEQGILLLEDLGQDTLLDSAGRPITERYRESVACLARLHVTDFERDIQIEGGPVHHIADFDRDAMKTEAELLIDWYLPWKRVTSATEAERQEYLAIWDGLIDQLAGTETSLLLRDFHSPNVIWRGAAEGLDRIGILDFQDAMIGPTAYDLASIVQDARVTIEPELADILMADYLALRRQGGNFDAASFKKCFAIMAAQRACKLGGIWVRLLERDHKPGYLKHMPRTLGYLSAAFEHDALSPLRDWCARVGIGSTESTL